MITRTHVLKTIGTAWDAVKSGEKKFEVRKNDRFFQRGDIVRLRRLDEESGCYTSPPGQSFGTMDLDFVIGWTLQGGQFGIEPGYVVFSLEPVPAPGSVSQ